jgi:hypothetical protein
MVTYSEYSSIDSNSKGELLTRQKETHSPENSGEKGKDKGVAPTLELRHRQKLQEMGV